MVIICLALQIYFMILIARVILSWFPVSGEGALAQVNSVVFQATEPVLGPLRRTIPPLGRIDISPIVAFIGISLLRGLICS